jgi:hypothetical protein
MLLLNRLTRLAKRFEGARGSHHPSEDFMGDLSFSELMGKKRRVVKLGRFHV